jgi:hypothetical protein
MKPAPLEILLDLFHGDTAALMDDPSGEPMFDAPFMGVANAQDPWFERFKEIIGPFYWSPQQALDMIAPGAIARSILCWCLPIGQTPRLANRMEKQLPARSWAYVRTFGEELNIRLRIGMEQRLRSMGFSAVAPAILPDNVFKEHPGVGISTNWSERHVAFVAGLGTFGISGNLITKRGVTHRLGSVVTNAVFEPDTRSYGDDPFAWCLKTVDGTCGVCITRCPAGSIGESVAQRNKEACAHHYAERVMKLCKPVFGWKGIYGCGLCQTGVPCEFRNPIRN